MKNIKDAMQLARTMVKIGNMNGTKTWAVLTNMNTPLADGVGSAMEIYSVVDAMNGKKSYLRKISLELASLLYQMANNCSYKKAKKVVTNIINQPDLVKGKLSDMIDAHGGDYEYLQKPEKLLNAKNCYELKSSKSGFVNVIDALDVAKYVMVLEEGLSDERKLFQGVLLNVQINSRVKNGDVLAKIYTDKDLSEKDIQNLEKAIVIESKRIKVKPLIYKVIKNVK